MLFASCLQSYSVNGACTHLGTSMQGTGSTLGRQVSLGLQKGMDIMDVTCLTLQQMCTTCQHQQGTPDLISVL